MTGYLVVYNGYQEKYGAEIYLLGEFSTIDKAHGAINSSPYKDLVKFKIIPVELDKVNILSKDLYGNIVSEDHLGGYIE